MVRKSNKVPEKEAVQVDENAEKNRRRREAAQRKRDSEAEMKKELERLTAENRQMRKKLEKTEEKDESEEPVEEQAEDDMSAIKKKAAEFRKKHGIPNTPMDGLGEKGKDAMKPFFDAMKNPEVQKHFITMGVEFMLGVTEFMKSLPITEEIKAKMNPDAAKAGPEGPAPKKSSQKKQSQKKSIEKIELK